MFLRCLYALRAKIYESKQFTVDHEEWEKATSAESAGVNFLTRSMVRLSFSSGIYYPGFITLKSYFCGG